ncbi:MAG: GNAT family N-acetyltransferase [Leptospirales bacterium]|jgi:aminoglycoside 6'-N-acetyltransferase
MSAYSLQPLYLDRNRIRVLVDAWLALPRVRDWWGEPDEAIELLSFCADRQTAVLLQAARRNIGCACWRTLSPHERAIVTTGAPEDFLLPGHIEDVDLFIGEPEALARGAGPIFLELIVRRIRRTYPQASVSVCIAEENQRALRAAQKADFQKQHRFQDSTDGPTWLLLRQP